MPPPPQDGHDLDELGLGVRAKNALLRAGIITIEQLTALTYRQLVRGVLGLGKGSLAEVQDALAARGLALAPDRPGARAPKAKRPSQRGAVIGRQWPQIP